MQLLEQGDRATLDYVVRHNPSLWNQYQNYQTGENVSYPKVGTRWTALAPSTNVPPFEGASWTAWPGLYTVGELAAVSFVLRAPNGIDVPYTLSTPSSILTNPDASAGLLHVEIDTTSAAGNWTGRLVVPGQREVRWDAKVRPRNVSP